jgi:hypothetical protein
MAEEVTNKKPKTRECAETKKTIKRKKWYYRDGQYFSTKNAYKSWKKKKTATPVASKS